MKQALFIPIFALAAALAVQSAHAQATVYFYADTQLTVGGSCDIYVDALPKVNQNTVVIGGIQVCRYDITNLAPGTHTLKAAAVSVAADPMWGAQTSAISGSITYVKVGTLPVPTNLRTGP